MKNTGLRIGNYFIEENTNKIIEVIGLEKNRVVFSGMFLHEWQAKPIQLNEEWLIKLGFEKQKGIYRSFYQSNDNNYLSICFDEDRYYFMDVNEDPSFSGFNHVHQLQNLYFALTQTELSYENETK